MWFLNNEKWFFNNEIRLLNNEKRFLNNEICHFNNAISLLNNEMPVLNNEIRHLNNVMPFFNKINAGVNSEKLLLLLMLKQLGIVFGLKTTLLQKSVFSYMLSFNVQLQKQAVLIDFMLYFRNNVLYYCNNSLISYINH